MGKTGKGYLFAILSAIIFGSMPLMAKHIYAEGVTPMTLVFLRNFIALLPLSILAYKEQKTLKIPVKKLPAISLISVLGCSITPIMLFTAYQFIDSSTATVFHFIYPAAVVLAEILFMKKKAQLHNIVSVLLCILGISLFYSPHQTLNLAGSVLALASGLTFAAYVVLLARFDKTSVSGFLFSFYVAAVSSVFSFVVCLCAGMLALPTSLLGWGCAFCSPSLSPLWPWYCSKEAPSSSAANAPLSSAPWNPSPAWSSVLLSSVSPWACGI